jgi:hypothetical protein
MCEKSPSNRKTNREGCVMAVPLRRRGDGAREEPRPVTVYCAAAARAVSGQPS